MTCRNRVVWTLWKCLARQNTFSWNEFACLPGWGSHWQKTTFRPCDSVRELLSFLSRLCEIFWLRSNRSRWILKQFEQSCCERLNSLFSTRQKKVFEKSVPPLFYDDDCDPYYDPDQLVEPFSGNWNIIFQLFLWSSFQIQTFRNYVLNWEFSITIVITNSQLRT